jgi:ribonuclease J
VAVAIGSDGQLRGTPEVRIQGLPVEEDREAFTLEACDDAAAAARKEREPDRVREAVRLAVRKTATRWTGKKPVIEVLVVRV